jgi:two-component sensor histidine kinase
MRWLALFRPPWPVSHLLAACIVALALPLVVLVGIDALRLTVNERARLHGEASLTAERIAADLDQTINSYIAILETLGTSPALGNGDFATLYAQATAALKPNGLYAFLRDASGQQLFNTRLAYGSPLPKSIGFDAPAFETRQPYVSDVVLGDVARRPVAAVSVPVVRSGKIKYVLSLSLELGLVKALLDRQKLPESWNVTVVDRNAVEIASTDASGETPKPPVLPQTEAGASQALPTQVLPPKEDYRSRKVIWGHAPSRLSGWSVNVSIPVQVVDASVRKVLFGYVAVVTAFMLAGLAGAFGVGRVITKPLEQATEAAKALGEGKTVAFEPTVVSEANAMGNALVESARLRDQAEQQIMLLMREVNHRSKNMLAVVQAIARQMIGSDPQSFVKRFSDRIVGLAASQDLLIESNWQGVRVGDLVRSQLSLFRELIGTRIFVDGPLVRFTPAAAQAVGMALHELATNASKYGALSDEHGRVNVSWRFDPSKEGQELSMSWVEEGGPPVTEPERRGFGYTIMVMMVEKSLDGKVELTYPPTGLSWSIVAPARCTYDAQETTGRPAARKERT